MDMDVRDLELLDALADGGTLIGAAETLYVSQPALSQRLLKLEERLGTPLFDRVGRRLVPNTAGLHLIPRASRILAEIAAAAHDTRVIARHGDRHVRLATQCATTFGWLTPVMRQLREHRSEVSVGVELVADDDLLTALAAGQIDIAVVTKLRSAGDHIRLEHIMDDEMVAVVGPKHPWAERRRVDGREFADENVILCDSYDATRASLPLPAGVRPARVTTVPMLTELVVELVAGGEGVAVLPSWVVAPFVARGDVVALSIGSRPQRRSWYAAVRADERRPCVDEFVALLAAHLAGSTADLPRAQKPSHSSDATTDAPNPIQHTRAQPPAS